MEEDFFAEVRRSKKNFKNEDLLIVLRWQMDFDRDQKAAAIDCLLASGIKG
jgi:hypothetical protein